MEFDVENTAVIVAAAIIAVLQYLDRRDRRRAAEEHELAIWAAAERSRRREVKRQRRESSGPIPLNTYPRSKSQPGVPQEFADEENTEPHDLIEMERERRKAHKSPTERSPRRGTHHD